MTHTVIREALRKGSLMQLKRIVFKYLALMVVQRAILTKALPIVGGAVGAVWNHTEVRAHRVFVWVNLDEFRGSAACT